MKTSKSLNKNASAHESDDSNMRSNARQILREESDLTNIEIGKRLAVAVDLIGSPGVAAEAAGVSVSTLQRYLRGEVSAPFVALAGVARRSGVSLDWLATGEGPRERDKPLLLHEYRSDPETVMRDAETLDKQRLREASQLVRRALKTYPKPGEHRYDVELDKAWAAYVALERGVPAEAVVDLIRPTLREADASQLFLRFRIKSQKTAVFVSNESALTMRVKS